MSIIKGSSTTLPMSRGDSDATCLYSVSSAVRYVLSSLPLLFDRFKYGKLRFWYVNYESKNAFVLKLNE